MNAKVYLLDGPCVGKDVRYGHPLPATLVVADCTYGIRYHDYDQIPHSDRYRHSRQCPCENRDRRPVNLDRVVTR